MSKRYALGIAAVLAILLVGPSPGGSTPVATNATAYELCGRVFPDPHAFWPAPAQAPGRSPFAKGNAACASVDFLSYADMVDGVKYLETLFPQFVEFYELERDFGDGSDCTSSTSNADMCSAGLPQQGVPAGRERSDLYLLRVTDERVPDTNKKFFTFPLSIHGIERAGAEAGIRAAEDLATWAAARPGARRPRRQLREDELRPRRIPHPLLETTPERERHRRRRAAALVRLLRLREPRRLAPRRPRQRRPLLPALQRQRRRHEPRLADDRLHVPAVHAVVRAGDARRSARCSSRSGRSGTAASTCTAS